MTDTVSKTTSMRTIDPSSRPATTTSGFAPRLGAMGDFGGRYVSELLVPVLDELDHASRTIARESEFLDELHHELTTWGGRPTPLTKADRLSTDTGLSVWLKREDLLHGGAHKTNNVVGQALLARRLGKRRLVAETGAGQHGVAVAMAAARFGLDAVVYMGAVDIERQRPNKRLMELCGAEVRSVDHGASTLKEAVNEALRDWTARADDTHYLLGSACGPDPFPRLVREFQSVIGTEARMQVLDTTGELPRAVVACVGGGSNAIGIWNAFRDDDVRLIGVEAAGRGHVGDFGGATITHGRPGLLHGARTYVLQDADGQTVDAESMAAGLDYPGVGPEHAAMHASGRARYVTATDAEARSAFVHLSRREGIVPAFESAHALAFLHRAVRDGELDAGDTVVVNLSGSGRKDLETWFALYADVEVTQLSPSERTS